MVDVAQIDMTVWYNYELSLFPYQGDGTTGFIERGNHLSPSQPTTKQLIALKAGRSVIHLVMPTVSRQSVTSLIRSSVCQSAKYPVSQLVLCPVLVS